MDRTINKNIRLAINHARNTLFDALDLTNVPDDHRISKQMNEAFEMLEEAYRGVRSQPTASLLEHTGPLVKVIPNRPPQKWVLNTGGQAGSLLRKTRFSKRKKLKMPRAASKQRVMTSKQFVEQLNIANPEN
jgi:hypothetical protein